MQSFKWIGRLCAGALLATALAAGSAAKASAKPHFFLHGGDTVVFMGDSITALHRATWPRGSIAPNYTYCMDIVSWATTHMPPDASGHCPVSFYDLGVGGDTTQGDEWPNGGPVKDDFVPPSTRYGASRTIDSDLAYVEALGPSVITLDYGMNDGEYVDCDPVDPGYNSALYRDFTSGITHIVSSLLEWSNGRKQQLRVVVLTPSYFDNARRVSAGWSFGWGPPAANYNRTLKAFGQWEKRYVSHLNNPNVTCIDLNGPMAQATGRLPAGQSLTQEGIHPTEQGYEVMAAAILDAWGAPSVHALNTRAIPNSIASKSVKVLPWDLFDGGTAYRVSPLPAAVNQLNLYGRGLEPGRLYEVQGNGRDIGIFGAKQLQVGVNLAGNTSVPGCGVVRQNDLMQRIWNAFNYGQQDLVPMAGGGGAQSFGWTGGPVDPGSPVPVECRFRLVKVSNGAQSTTSGQTRRSGP